jgi:ATP-dependent DNA helicase RecG
LESFEQQYYKVNAMSYERTHKLPANESETVEFKTSFNVETIETLVAFANAKGGSVYVGIADDASVTGVR